MSDLIFLDVETTGLDPAKHEIWEFAWAVNNGPVNLNHYLEKYPTGARAEGPMVDLEIRSVLAGNTLVCSNPTFDRMFMFFRWGYEPYHYRSIDIESMALLLFEWERPRGLTDIATELRDYYGYDIPVPNHSAFDDVVATRACYNAMRDLQSEYKQPNR
jgi:oligoribonuclease (3'-5' exoribonuclease)